MYGSRLTRDFGESVPETWKKAIQNLDELSLQRGLRNLLRTGSASVPTLPVFVKACRTIGEDDGPSRPVENALPGPQYDPYHAHAQKCLSVYLQKRGMATEGSLSAMLHAKKRIVQQFRDIAAEEEVTGTEIRDALFKAFDPLWQPFAAHELERSRETFLRTGYAADWSPT